MLRVYLSYNWKFVTFDQHFPNSSTPAAPHNSNDICASPLWHASAHLSPMGVPFHTNGNILYHLCHLSLSATVRHMSLHRKGDMSPEPLRLAQSMQMPPSVVVHCTTHTPSVAPLPYTKPSHDAIDTFHCYNNPLSCILPHIDDEFTAEPLPIRGDIPPPHTESHGKDPHLPC